MKQKGSLLVFLALALLVWAYLWLRAIYVPLVHDEIATFHNYIQIGKFLPWSAHWDANNHILNSAVSALFYRIFGLSPLVIRLANLLFFPLFCIYLWKTGSFFVQPLVRWACYISLLMAHGFIEFFSLSRGYGISMALLIPALYYLIRLTEQYSLNRLLASLLFAAFATLANLSLFNTCLILFTYLLLFGALSKQITGTAMRIKAVAVTLAAGTPFLILFAMISFEFRAKGLLYTGGGNGIWEDTVKTLFYRLFSTDDLLPLLLMVSMVCLIAMVSFLRLIKEGRLFSPKLVYAILLTGNLAGVVLLHLLLRVNYPENRVALFLFPFFIGAFCFAMDDVTRLLRSKTALVALIPLILIPIHFFTHLNLAYASFYIEDLIPASFYQTVKNNHRTGEYPPIVSGPRLTHFCWSFYDFCEDGTESQISFTNFPENLSDFQIADTATLPVFGEDYIMVDSSPVNQRYLLKRKIPASRTLIAQVQQKISSGPVDQEYYRLYTTSLSNIGGQPDLEGQSLYVGITAGITSPEEPFHTWIAAEVNDSTGKVLQYERLSLYWFRPAWNQSSNEFKNGLFLSQIPPGAASLKVYIWNIEKVPFRVENGVVEIFVLSD